MFFRRLLWLVFIVGGLLRGTNTEGETSLAWLAVALLAFTLFVWDFARGNLRAELEDAAKDVRKAEAERDHARKAIESALAVLKAAIDK